MGCITTVHTLFQGMKVASKFPIFCKKSQEVRSIFLRTSTECWNYSLQLLQYCFQFRAKNAERGFFRKTPSKIHRDSAASLCTSKRTGLVRAVYYEKNNPINFDYAVIRSVAACLSYIRIPYGEAVTSTRKIVRLPNRTRLIILLRGPFSHDFEWYAFCRLYSSPTFHRPSTQR